MDSVLEILLKWEKWFKRTLFTAISLGLLYGAYKYGYEVGLEKGIMYMLQREKEEAATNNSYRKPLNSGDPGRMWEPEA